MQKCMDWKNANFDWNRAKAFLVVAEQSSLSGAARELGLAQPTIGRQIASLEEELGVTLIDRAANGVILTETGLALAEHVRLMGEAANKVALTASGNAQSIEGTVRISATETDCVYLLVDILAELRELQPGIRIELLATDSVSDLRKREADIALRNGRPTSPDLFARLVREDVAHLYAATSYLERHGRPQSPDDFLDAKMLGFDDDGRWLAGLKGLGLPVESGNIVSISNSHVAMWEMTKAGMGIGVNSESRGDAEPGVERAAPFMPGFAYQLWLVSHRELKTSRRIRLVFDFLAERISALPQPLPPLPG
jgi:DNA-binding transcriptional LysR family regulator